MNKYQLTSDAMTRQFGAELANAIAAASPDMLTIYLVGSLGAGKTTTVRGLLNQFGYNGAVKSPTYALLESYELNPHTIYHFDLYRLSDPEELEFMGIREYSQPGAVTIFEWPEQGAGVIPDADLVISYHILEGAREVTVDARTEVGIEVTTRWGASV